jgi:hypothetical protein
MKRFCVLVGFILVISVVNAQNQNGQGQNGQNEHHVDYWCRQFNHDGSVNTKFARRNAAILGDLNLNRAAGEVWRGMIETYGKPAGYGGLFYPIAPKYPYYSDHVYDESICSFRYTQAWYTVTAAGKYALKIQRVNAKINEPTSTDGDSNVEGPATYTVAWDTPAIWQSLPFAGLPTTQTAVDGHNILLSISKLTGLPYQEEQRSIQVPNSDRDYSTMVYLDQVLPGLEDNAIWLFFDSVTVATPPPEINLALAAFYANQIPLLPDPDVPAGVPGVPPIYLYIIPGQGARSIASNNYTNFVGFTPSTTEQARALISRVPASFQMPSPLRK